MGWVHVRSLSVWCGAACLLALLSACGTEDTALREESESAAAVGGEEGLVATMVHECPGGANFVARIEGDRVWLFLRGRTVALPHVPSASGARYSDGETVYWSKGEEASIESPEITAQGCINNRREAVWEHAKLNGVEFRAVGNEPGWHMEITRGDSIVLVSDYGTSRYAFPTPVADVNRDELRTVYRTDDGEHALVVTLEGKRCLDTMVEESYGTTVTVLLDGRELRGCGRPLF